MVFTREQFLGECLSNYCVWLVLKLYFQFIVTAPSSQWVNEHLSCLFVKRQGLQGTKAQHNCVHILWDLQYLTHWPLGDLDAISKLQFSISFYWLVSSHRLKDNALRWMPRDLTDDKSTLVQVMAWCLQATSHYLSLCWPRSLSPYDVTRPQWVNSQSLSLTVKTLPSYLIATCVSCFLFLNCASQPATSVCVPSRSWS